MLLLWTRAQNMQFSHRKSTVFCYFQFFNPSICLPTRLSIKWGTCPHAGEDCSAGTRLDDQAQVNPAQLSLKGAPKVTVGNSKHALTCAACLWCQEDEQGVRVPWAMPRVCGVWWWRDLSLQSPPLSISLPAGLRQTMGWLYCSVYPWEQWDSGIPKRLCSCRV